MAKKIFKTEKLDQVKEKTTNMFQQCGGSGTVSPPHQYEPDVMCRETEFKISTLESTYRTPHFGRVPRHCVSDSNIFMHRDMDWYREPRPLDCETGVRAGPRRPPPSVDHVETFTTRVRTPGNVLVRFRTFLGMEGSTVEVVTNNSDCVISSDSRTKNSKAVNFSKLNNMRNIFKFKSTETSAPPEVVPSEEKIVRMKTFFGNRPPPVDNTVVIESNSSGGMRNNFGKIRTFFKTDTGSQTDDIATTEAEPEQRQRWKFKNLRNFGKSVDSRSRDDSLKNTDDRHIFSRQSTLPAQQAEPEASTRRMPVWMDGFVKRVRASCAGARVNDIEIPNAVVMEPKDSTSQKKGNLGSITGWRWRRGNEIHEEGRREPWWNIRNCTIPTNCNFPKLAFIPTITSEHTIDKALQFTQVIALICGILVVILMGLGLSSADWLMAAGWRQGLFTHCVEEGAPTPLPFNLVEQPGCYSSRDVGYIRAAAALCIVTLCADLLGSLLTALGLRSSDHHTKYKYYRLAVLAMSLALISILIALVIYPVCFAAELNLGNRTVWEFGWAYGVGWGAAIFLFGAVILLLCDKESEEIYYKERKVERAQPPGGA